MTHQAPSRGVLDGIKNDLKKAKEGDGYNPNGVGNAYSHNFLNQKPWHPANFRNQAKVYEAQQAKIHAEKQKEIAKAEFQAEQEYLQTLSFLSPEEQEKYRERQGVQFMYMKPPGADSLLTAPPAAQKPAEPTEQPTSAAPVDASSQAAMHQRPRLPEGRSHVGNMLGAVRALKNHDKWEVKHVAGMGHSPPRGAALGGENQTFLASSGSESGASEGSQPRAEEMRQAKKDRIAEAEAVLRRAGIDVEEVRRAERKRQRKEKKQKKKKRKKD